MRVEEPLRHLFCFSCAAAGSLPPPFFCRFFAAFPLPPRSLAGAGPRAAGRAARSGTPRGPVAAGG